ncbi:MAG: alkaline phosphatase family protein [Acidobacteria bacterium]|nr:alkaline phosphatase family protein [Acidobacteriota bacterium]
MQRFKPFLAFSVWLVMLPSTAATETREQKVKLIVQITVDQLRGDMLLRYKHRFGRSGFRYLMDRGVNYTNAHFQHLTTFTAVGHATLVTGGYAAQHGMAGNDWQDRESGQHVLCVEDDRHTLIGKEREPHSATSPRNLTSSTIGDELVLASGHNSRVFSVSIKGRAAIIPGGHLGKAFWYSSNSGEFVTSTYYYHEYPAWVVAWNKSKHADEYIGRSWELLYDKASYIYGNADDRTEEKSHADLGRTFPHAISCESSSECYEVLPFTPYGDELTFQFAKELMKSEELGQRDATDMLAISLSTTDRIGHAFGPNSLEYEDNLLHLDAGLADLFKTIDATVGLDKSVIVLSSDHGVDEIPEYKQSLGFEAGRHFPKKFIESVNIALQARFESSKDFVLAFWNPSLYLNLETVRDLELDLAAVERAVAEEMAKVPGIAVAVTRTDLLAGKVLDTPMMRKVQRAFHPERTGDVIIVQNQFWYLHPKAEAYSAMHGSPYSYDTYVPIIFYGPGIRPRTIHRPVAPADIAATLASYLGIKPPSGSVGAPLLEVLRAD